ncbi:amidohydrolase family protein [Paenibacillus sp. FSL P4-0338]|uniref:N-acetylglucosamine-6-phosphate deacetylase n=1 Tax=unclassified Paenibacillus TaxID=185978 RepID=UPI0003E2C21B|nr:amidohydrolase family protein [Paenibacillus sp. FSL R7-269]ETT56230.1 N-acetylglucosamine-6-phosphate deacetylase [Paenibacillus sp. FSL R7-269]
MNGVISGRHYRTGLPIEVHVNGGVIEAVHTLAENPHMADWPWLAPGLVDLQVNGGWGLDFNTLPLVPETVAGLSRRLLARGVTSYCPTLITNGPDQLTQAASAIAEAVQIQPDIAGQIAGIHLEGPFLSPEDGPRGAHPLEHICPPDWESLCRWQEAAEGLIRIITVSPEWPGAAAFISRCSASGIRVSIGHTAASPDQIRQAVAAGAVMSTHLGNGTHLTLPRHPHYLWEQLAADELYGCMIADGCHLPDALLKVILRVKQSRAILVSDAVSLSGMAPGAYRLHIGGDVVLTPEGRLHLAGHPRLLAGSAMMLADQVAYLARAGLVPLADAIDCASVHPAELLELPQAAGLTAGRPADLIGFRKNGGGDLEIQAVWKNGRLAAAGKG